MFALARVSKLYFQASDDVFFTAFHVVLTSAHRWFAVEKKLSRL